MSHKFLVSSLTAAVALSLSATAMAKDAGGVERNFEQITVIGSQASN